MKFWRTHRLGAELTPWPPLERVSIFSKRSDGECNGKPETENGKQKTGQFGRFYIFCFRFSVFRSFILLLILLTSCRSEPTGGRVIVLGRVWAQSHASAIRDSPTAWVFALRAGRIVRATVYPSASAALTALRGREA